MWTTKLRMFAHGKCYTLSVDDMPSLRAGDSVVFDGRALPVTMFSHYPASRTSDVILTGCADNEVKHFAERLGFVAGDWSNE
jgi:hypothetical protein